MLKKEFNKKDVQRARNLIAGNSGNSTGIQIGYKKEKINHKEGDVWKEGRKTWTIKNGIKQTISKLDAIKKEVFIPLCCPQCSKVMKHWLDKDNYKTHKTCHDCVIEFEHKLRIEGKYEDYKNKLISKNELSIVDDLESYLLNAVNSTNEGYISEQGEVERWVGGVDKEKMSKDIIEGAKIRRKHIQNKLNGK
ncbi:hypothetical protein OAU28_01365 [Flavobacteriales bacterium]|nr:hypothetical protein [Flavobacteriales bacterium]